MTNQVDQVCIINVFGTINRGDAAIFASLVKVVKDSFKRRNREVNIHTLARYATNMDWSPVLKDVTFYEPLFASYYSSRWLRRLFSVYIIGAYLLWMLGARPLALFLIPQRKRQALRAIENAGYVLSCGGAFLDDSTFSFIMNLLEINLALALHKPVVLVSQSIGPFRRKWARRFASSILRNVSYVLPRETWSERYVVEQLGIPQERVHLVPDLAFDAPRIEKAIALELLKDADVDTDKVLVGMTVLKWSYPGSSDSFAMHKRYVAEMARLCDYIVDRYGLDIVLIPQFVRGREGGEDDMDVASAVRGQASCQTHTHLLSRDYTPDAVKGIIGCMTVFVGTRMHSNIFALSQHVPSMAISYLPKTTYIMEALDLSEYVIDITEVDFAKMCLVFDRLWAKRSDLSEHLQRVIPKLQQRIPYMLDIVLDALAPCAFLDSSSPD